MSFIHMRTHIVITVSWFSTLAALTVKIVAEIAHVIKVVRLDAIHVAIVFLLDTLDLESTGCVAFVLDISHALRKEASDGVLWNGMVQCLAELGRT